MSDLTLKPTVTGRLAAMEKAAIDAVQAGETFRTTISIDPVIGLAAIRAADAEDRDFSAFIKQVLKEHAANNPLPSDEHAELLSRVAVVLRRRPAVARQLERVVTTATRAHRAGGKVAA